jgi:hypothetical protein
VATPRPARNTVAMGWFSDGRLVRWARQRQSRRLEEERRLARSADSEDEARAHERRAEKASYLRAKLDEREQSDRAAGSPSTGDAERDGS